MSPPIDRKAIDLKLVTEAVEPDVNIAPVIDAIASRANAEEKARLWKIENHEAFEYWSGHFDKHGLPLAKYRLF